MRFHRFWMLAAACIFSGNVFAQSQADDPVSLVENITGKIFSDVTENLDEYTENPEALEDLVRKDICLCWT